MIVVEISEYVEVKGHSFMKYDWCGVIDEIVTEYRGAAVCCCGHFCYFCVCIMSFKLNVNAHLWPFHNGYNLYHSKNLSFP